MELVRTFVVNDWELKIAFNEPDHSGVPSKSNPSHIAPGAGKYQIIAFELASVKVTAGEALSLLAQINGENIAFLYTELYLKDPERDYYYGPLMHEHVRSKVEKEINGLIHPVWDSDINLSVEIAPLIRVLTDGINAAFAFMHPGRYGQEEVQLEGLFTKKNSGKADRARLKFDLHGEMIDKQIILEKRGRLMTHDLVIKSGDMFIPAVHVLTTQNLATPQMRSIHGISGTITKLEDPFHWVDEAPLPGDYLLGLVIEDFNGDRFHHYLPFTIVGE
ncbi:MAG: hypothetical protein CVU42_01460 [Chloroflexi bacterium HGW-Chloroflexi-4]|jgi:hypothetical protein|nr:MAG: hypothetical protein CVU42_01460 [Chloroflexi bacterium HGW-Chloroflexi-4]